MNEDEINEIITELQDVVNDINDNILYNLV